MKKNVTRILLVAVALAFLISGCAIVTSPVAGGLYTGVKAPMSATGNDKAGKMGTGVCSSVLGLVAWGDCSVNTAAKAAGITKIRDVDYQVFSVLGIYGTFTVNVTGE